MAVITWCLFGMGVGFMLGGAFWLLTIQRKRAAQREIYPFTSYRTSPPDDLPPALVGRLINGAYGFLGDIFYLAEQGFLTIREEVQPSWYGRKRDFLLERRDKKNPPYRYQAQLIKHLFRGKPRIRLSENRYSWRRTVEQIREQLDADGIRLGLLKRIDRETIRTTGWGTSHLSKIGLACVILGIVALGLSIVIQAGAASLFTGGGFASQQCCVVGAASAVVAGGGPDCFLVCRVELPGDQARHQAAKGGSHLVGAGGEPFAYQADDARRYAGERRWKFQVVDAVEAASLGHRLVLPGDAEQIQRVHVPQADVLQLCLDSVGDQRRIFHLRKGGDDDVALSCALNRTF